MYKIFNNNEKKIWLKNSNCIFEINVKKNTSKYFQKIRKYNLLAIDNQKITYKKELKKSTF